MLCYMYNDLRIISNSRAARIPECACLLGDHGPEYSTVHDSPGDLGLGYLTVHDSWGPLLGHSTVHDYTKTQARISYCARLPKNSGSDTQLGILARRVMHI